MGTEHLYKQVCTPPVVGNAGVETGNLQLREKKIMLPCIVSLEVMTCGTLFFQPLLDSYRFYTFGIFSDAHVAVPFSAQVLQCCSATIPASWKLDILNNVVNRRHFLSQKNVIATYSFYTVSQFSMNCSRSPWFNPSLDDYAAMPDA